MHSTALPFEHTCTRKFLRWLVCLCAEAMVTCPSFAATFVRLSSMPGVFHAAFWPPSSHRAVVRCAILGWHTARYLSQYAWAWASRDCSPCSLRSYHCMVKGRWPSSGCRQKTPTSLGGYSFMSVSGSQREEWDDVSDYAAWSLQLMQAGQWKWKVLSEWLC